MAASWFAKGAVTARLLSSTSSTVNAAPKRHQQPDFQASSTWRAPSAKSVHSSTPSLFLLQKGKAAGGGGDSGSGSGSESDDGQATAPASSSQEDAFLAHTKPRKGSCSALLLKLRQLTGSDLRDMLQKDAVQTGIPVELSARLAQHTEDEAKRYASNCAYELSNSTAQPLMLASPEFAKVTDALPAALGPADSLDGVPVDLAIFNSNPAQSAVAAAATAAVPADLAAYRCSASMQDSIRQINGFISSFEGLPNLNALLHEPAVLKANSSVEQLPAKLLRTFEGAVLHLRSPGFSVADFCSRLPSVSAAGLAAPAADRLVCPELAAVYTRLAAGIDQLSSQQHGGVSGSACEKQLRLLHFSQTVFGRLDLAWEALSQQQQQQGPH